MTWLTSWWNSLHVPWRAWRVVACVAAADEVPRCLPYKGAILIGPVDGPTWVALDCPCSDMHRIMLNLDKGRYPAWSIESSRPLSIWPSIDAQTANGHCHFVVRSGRILTGSRIIRQLLNELMLSRRERDTRVNHERRDPSPSRTPLYEAFNAVRYQRQVLIREIQRKTKLHLISYVSSNGGAITRDDVVPFADLLHNIPTGEGIELLLHTPGGDPDTAEKLSSMVRDRVGSDAPFHVVVPDFAKSAGTLMALGADFVVMSDTSELGPIDPQVQALDSSGQSQWIAAQRYLDAFEEHTATLTSDPENVAAQIMIGKLDPAHLQFCRAVKERAQRLAEKQLKRGMFRDNWGELDDDRI